MIGFNADRCYRDTYYWQFIMAAFKEMLVILVITGLVQSDQDAINYIASNLGVTFNVVNNYDYSFSIALHNTGPDPIPADGDLWSLYFCNIRLLQPDEIRANGSTDVGHGLRLEHINGCLFKIDTIVGDFVGISPDETLDISLNADAWTISRTDVMPNWYVTGDGLDPRVIQSTVGESLEFVSDFTKPEQWKRIAGDKYDPYTGSQRYNMRNYEDKGKAALVLPTPFDESLDASSSVNIDNPDWVVVLLNEDLRPEAEYLAEKLGTIVVSTPLPSGRYISLNIDTQMTTLESYRLDTNVDTEIIQIKGGDDAGVFYGVQTLLSLREPGGLVPSGYVEDHPRFYYRGMHVDTGRNFHSKEDILRILDVMVMYKLNKFHFHLTDDEGWRLEIPGIPELTEVGGQRCHDPSGDECIMPQLGSAPGKVNDGSGFYTVDDYKEILQYADERHVEVIPEFDMPGHCHAAINAMKARWRKYKDSNQTAAFQYRLDDPDDDPDYYSVQYYRDNAVNPCVDGPANFITKLIREVKDMHAGIQTLETFHFGGDEVPGGAWSNSPACNTTDSDAVKQHFLRQVADIADDEGLNLSGWEDGFTTEHVPQNMTFFPNDKVYSYVWDNVWEWGGGQGAYMFANKGYQTILCHATHLYFDHPQEPDPEERGFYWATRIAPIRKTFGYMPDSVYDNIDIDRMGNPLDKDQICQDYGCEPLEEVNEQYIIGMQGHIWSETVRTSEQLDYMVFPRMLAIAERAWHKASWEEIIDPAEREAARTLDYETFANTLGYKELSRLDKMGVNYRVPPPGVRVTDDNKLQIKSEFPGLPVQVSTDQGSTWSDFQSDRIMDPGQITAITRSSDRSRISRASTATVEGNISSGYSPQMSLVMLLSVFIIYKIAILTSL